VEKGGEEKNEREEGSWRWWNRIYDCWDRVGDIKDDECERSEYKGEDLAYEVGIFCYEGEFGGAPVWLV
jgi:hypothetical protein